MWTLLFSLSLGVTTAQVRRPPSLFEPGISHSSFQPSPYFLDTSTVVQIVCGGASGSGFFIGDQKFVTAAHVVRGQARCTINGAVAQILKIGDALHDYAILRAAAYPPFRVVTSCARLKEGQPIFSTGYAEGNKWQVTTRGRAAEFHYADLTVFMRGAIVLGMSGGPISDEDGVVHGINDWQSGDGVPGAGVVELADTSLCSAAKPRAP